MKKNQKKRLADSATFHSRTIEVDIEDSTFMSEFFGMDRQHITTIEEALGICIGSRGNRILIQGRKGDVEKASDIIKKVEEYKRRGGSLSPSDINRMVVTLLDNPATPIQDVRGDIIIHSHGKRIISAKSPAQRQYIEKMKKADIVFAIGPAGTGKTYLAVAMAVSFLFNKKFKRIILTRPAVEAGEKLGYLPGDYMEKVNPYLRPLYDALHDLLNFEKSSSLIERGIIEVAPLAFMRGRTLNSSFIILDEAQNTTITQMKMFLTRLGFDSKAVIAGDITQIDIHPKTDSGLIDSVNLFKDIPGIEFCHFTEKDVVRHPLVQKIIKIYEQRENRKN